MYSRSVTLIFSFVFCLLLGSHGSSAAPSKRPRYEPPKKLLTRQNQLATNQTDPPSSVFRSDERGPEKVKAAGGFLPHSDMPPRNPTAYGLYNHVMDAVVDNSTRKRDTVYVSTSASFGVAATFTQLKDPENRWVYHIAATPNMVDVNASLPNFSRTVHQEAEYAAAGGIHWSQVKGWLLVPADYKPVVLLTDTNEPDLSNEDFAALSDKYIKNEDYNVRWDAYTASGPQPQLAGLAESSAVKWVNDKPWSEFKGKSVQDYLREFMETNGTAIGWRDFLPLFPPTQDAKKSRARCHGGGQKGGPRKGGNRKQPETVVSAHHETQCFRSSSLGSKPRRDSP